MLTLIENLIILLRRRRSLHVAVIVLRMLIGFAFLPAGLKKVLGEPFTDPGKTGAFHDFLHAFHDAGFFYNFVGWVQLIAAVLLITQRFAFQGALLIAPVLIAIMVFCWSTWVVPTATVVTLMTLGLCGLLIWDLPRLRGLWSAGRVQVWIPGGHPTINPRLWAACGWMILAVYGAATLLAGGVYRPRGAEWSNPSFLMLVGVAVLPVVTFVVDYARRPR